MKKMKKLISAMTGGLALSLLFFLFSCGGGGGGGGGSALRITGVSASPTSVSSGGTVSLSVSVDYTGAGNLTYQWQQISPSSPRGIFSSTEGSSVRWTAPTVSQQTTFVFRVTVSDGSRTLSSNVTVTVLPGGAQFEEVSSVDQAVSALVYTANAQEGCYFTLLDIFSDGGTKELFSPEVTVDESDYDAMFNCIDRVIDSHDAFQKAINYLSENGLSLESTGTLRPLGLFQSIKNFFYNWAFGSRVRMRQRIQKVWQHLDEETKEELFEIAREDCGDAAGNSPEEFYQKLQNGDLDRYASRLHRDFCDSGSEYADWAQEENLTPEQVVYEEGKEGVKAGADLMVDAATTVVNAKFSGFSDGFEKGKEVVEKLDQVYRDPVGTVKEEIKDKAKEMLTEKLGLPDSEALEEAAEMATSAIKAVRRVRARERNNEPNSENPKSWNWGDLNWKFSEGENATSPDDVEAALVVSDDGELLVDVDLGEDPFTFLEEGDYDVLLLGDDVDDYRELEDVDVEPAEDQPVQVDIPPPEPEQVGYLKGKVTDAVTGNPIEGVKVWLKDPETGGVISTATTGADGTYNVGRVVAGTYTITFTKRNYLTASGTAEIEANQTLDFAQVMMINENASGSTELKGQVLDAVTGEPVPGAAIMVYRGIYSTLEKIDETETDENGNYSVTLTPGYYTVTASKQGYKTNGFYFSIDGTKVSIEHDFSIAPNDSDVIRIVLTWGASPEDLDSHLYAPKPDDPSSITHIYYDHMSYSNPNTGEPYYDLDHDDTSSFGPETITIHYVSEDFTYRYYVHDFSNGSSWDDPACGGTPDLTALGRSGAKVDVYWGEIHKTFYVPSGTGNTWYVFKIENGEIIPVGTLFTHYGDDVG